MTWRARLQSALFNEMCCLVGGGTVWLQDELGTTSSATERRREERLGADDEHGRADVGLWACAESQEVLPPPPPHPAFYP